MAKIMFNGSQTGGSAPTSDTAREGYVPSRLSDANLKAAFDIVNVANSSGDVAAITAAIAARTSGGKVNGASRTSRGTVARISTPTTIALGYSNTQAANWATDTTTEKVRLSLDILPAANLGTALTIKGGYGVELDINVLGGGARGSVTDAAVNASSTTVSSPAAIAAGLQPGAVVFITGAGPAPEGIVQPRAASVRTVNAGAGTFTISEAAETTVSAATMTWFDVAIRLEDCVGLKLNIYGKGFQGYLLAADATDDTTKRLRSCDFPSIAGHGCGGTMFWKSIEAFGSIGHILSTSVYGDYFGQGADLHWDHWEGGITQPTSQLARTYLWFDRYGQVNNLSISAGDRATEAAVLMTGDSASQASMGRFAQVRATMYQAVGTGATITNNSNQVTNVVSSSLTFKVGQTIIGPGIPSGTTITAVTGSGSGYTAGSPGTITMSATATSSASSQVIYGATCDGLKLIGVSSVTITQLDTSRCVAGLRVIGGGATGIRVLHHKSLTSDITGLVVQGGTTGAPRLDVFADYRFLLGYAVDLQSGLLATGDIRLRGHLEGMHQATGGATGKYAARSASTAAVLDIAGLHLKSISGLLGLIDTTTVALKGRALARLESGPPAKGTLYYADGAGDLIALPAGGTGTVPTWQADGSIAPAAPGGGGGGGGTALVVGTAQTVITNTVTETVAAGPYTIPAGSVLAGTTYRIRAWGTVDNDASATVTLRCRIGGASGTSIASPFAITSTAKTNQGWNLDYILTFRTAAASATPVTVGGQAYTQTSGGNTSQGAVATNVNMTTARDLVIAATWSAASATNILRCEGFTIEKVN